jgi:uncharacterized protein YciI
MSDKQYFLYRLLPPRPGFAFDMSPAEAAVMQAHGDYWDALLAAGTAVVFGPVAEPTGAWGLGVLEVDDPADAERVREHDPAVTTGTLTAELHPMVAGFARPFTAA